MAGAGYGRGVTHAGGANDADGAAHAAGPTVAAYNDAERPQRLVAVLRSDVDSGAGILGGGYDALRQHALLHHLH